MRDLPAGIDPSELAAGARPPARAAASCAAACGTCARVRELLLRDLGGFVFEIHRAAATRAGGATASSSTSKTDRIDALDAEVRRPGGRARRAARRRGRCASPASAACARECGELHASDAHYCARCGAPLNGKARARRDAAVAAAAQPATGSQPTVEPAPASVLWAAGAAPARPRARPGDEKEKTDPSLATSEWLALPKQPEDAPGDDPARPEARAAARRGRDARRATTTHEPRADGREADAAQARLEPRPRQPAEDFEPTPDGKPAPAPDPLSSRPEQGS